MALQSFTNSGLQSFSASGLQSRGPQFTDLLPFNRSLMYTPSGNATPNNFKTIDDITFHVVDNSEEVGILNTNRIMSSYNLIPSVAGAAHAFREVCRAGPRKPDSNRYWKVRGVRQISNGPNILNTSDPWVADDYSNRLIFRVTLIGMDNELSAGSSVIQLQHAITNHTKLAILVHTARPTSYFEIISTGVLSVVVDFADVVGGVFLGNESTLQENPYIVANVSDSIVGETGDRWFSLLLHDEYLHFNGLGGDLWNFDYSVFPSAYTSPFGYAITGYKGS